MTSTEPLRHAPAVELAAIDLAFGRMVARAVQRHGALASPGHDGGNAAATAELLRHTALLVSAERALGNSCIDLRQHAGQPSPDVAQPLPTTHGAGEVPAPWCFPPVAAWQSALLASGVCANAGVGLHAAAYEGALFVLDGTQLYLARYFAAECRLAAAIRARLAEPPMASFEAVVPLFRQLFPHAAKVMDWQALAATAALRSSLTFITGGPGTGKTTVAAKLLALLLQGDATLRIAVAAPTGRAAARLAEAIGAAAAREQLGPLVTQHLPATGSTLHRLLGYQPWADRFTHHAAHPLADDIIVVDEASMVDVLMMDALFAAVKPSARLIVLGDPDQLASVDTGFVLGDIARASRSHGNEVGHSASLGAAYATLSGADPSLLPVSPQATALHNAVIRLRTSYRFGAQPGIGALAMATQAGNAAAAVQVLHDGALSDVAMHAPARSLVEQLGPVLPQLEHYLASSTPAEALGALAQFRVLCALRDGEAGVTGLNQRIERWLQQRGRTVAGWYDHRPVLITANDPATQLFNGDVGTTLAVDGVPLVHFPLSGGGYRSLAPSRLPAHETAWAMTVHKSQGSEFDHVLLVLPDTDSRILTRELVYTGLTRARRAVTISGTDELLRLAISRSVARVSGLTARLA